MYWLLNTETNTPAICGSVIAVSEVTGISENTLYTAFSRKKLKEYNFNQWRICKMNVIKPAKSAKSSKPGKDDA